jgi:hypothetical protein
MKANSDKSKQSNKATRRVLAGVLCGASVLSLVLSLVMPPISQAIANDAQTVSTKATVADAGALGEDAGTDENVLGEEAGAGNSTGKDAENQNSDETEGDEPGDDAQLEGQPEEEQQNEGTTTSDGETVAAVAENEQAGAAAGEIANKEELCSKLQGVQAGKSASFKLMQNIEYNGEINLNKSGSNITLDLNGCKIKHSGENQNRPLFNVSNGAEFTIKDDSNQDPEKVTPGQKLDDQGQKFTSDYYGKNATVDYDKDNIPTLLTYYVTKSSANDTGTTETLETHEANIKGAIVSTASKGSKLKLINVYAGGKFNLQGGTLTQKEGCGVGNLIYAENGSTVNMSGGYVCGASGSGIGAGIMVSNEQGSASTLYLTGGVIVGNSAYSGGGVYARYSKVTITNGVISGNSTLGEGLGGGIMAEGGIVNVSGGYITNNRMAQFCGKDGNGDHGGGGLAANNGAYVTISGGQITGNYSDEAGGGVYVTNLGRGDMAWLDITGGYIASNVSFRSEGAGIRVGQRVDAMINGPKDSNGTKKSTVYITNNRCMSRYDWGGGGIFVQGDSKYADNAGRLFVYNSYISSNTAGGYGGGVAVCPSGKTLVTNTEGTAIFGNKSAGNEYPGENYPDPAYDPAHNTGNDKAPHLSKGGDGKNQDYTAYLKDVFRDNGHADFFLAAHDHTTPIAAVTGEMLGGGDARYSGSIELEKVINIPANGAVGVKKSIGLTSGVMSGVTVGDKVAIQARGAAQNEATTFITGNYSWDHGGGIMSNGDLYLGVPADAHVYPSLKLKATKALNGRNLKDGEFSFTVYRKDSNDPFAKGTFNRDACTKVGTANNDANGNITFNLGEQFAANGTANTITYYLVENAGTDSDITYDTAVYEIVVTVEDHQSVLMSVPTRDNPNSTTNLIVHNYTINSMTVTRHSGDSPSDPRSVQADSDGYYLVAGSNGEKTFTNKYTPYTSSGSWIPKATKVVEGGEMKEFTLQLATDKEFTKIVQNKSTKTDAGKSQTLSFDEIKYELTDLEKLASDSTGRGASKIFTYYVREQRPTTPFTNYKYDQSVYEITVNATDNSNHQINVTATYKQIQDRDGKPVTTDKGHELTDESIPTFTNTYSTTLPLSGMSGVTLTYLAGAAVLCAAAAWMHIRRKANAKGGERRE